MRSRPYNLCLLSPSHVLLLLFVFALFSSLYLVCLSFSGLLETVKKMVMLILISVFSACAFLLFSLSFFLPSPGFSFSLICNLPFFRSLSLFSLGSASSFLLVFPLFFSPFVAFFFSLLCFFEKKQRNESFFSILPPVLCFSRDFSVMPAFFSVCIFSFSRFLSQFFFSLFFFQFFFLFLPFGFVRPFPLSVFFPTFCSSVLLGLYRARRVDNGR